jgi:uncharacterized protein (TIGR03790 family)
LLHWNFEFVSDFVLRISDLTYHSAVMRSFPLAFLCAIFFAAPSSASLTADELVLIVNGNIPVSVKTAEFYAKARLVPEGRIIKLNLPAGEEIPFEKYESEVVPQVRAFLRENELEKQVTCAVTFFGVPIRIGARRATDEDAAEVAELKRQLPAIAQRLMPHIREVEQIAEDLDPAFTPRVGEDPSDLSARADHALQSIARHMPPASDPRHKDLLPRLVQMTQRFGGDAQVADRLKDSDIQMLLAPEDAKKWPARRPEVAAAQKEIVTLHDKRYDPASRKRLRELMAEYFGLFGEIESVQAQLDYLSSDGTVSAFDNELALLWWKYYNRSRWLMNPLNVRFNGRPPPTLMVCRLDGPQEGTATQIILASLKAEKEGLKGRIVIDSMGGSRPDGKPDTEGGYRAFDEKLARLAQLINTNTKMPLTFDRRHPVLPPNSIKDVAIYAGWYSVRNYVPSCEFKAGAVGYHIASYEMLSLRTDNEKGWVAGLLNDGIGSTLGAVAEPYLSSMPSPDEFFPLLLTGKLTLAEVYWKTTPNVSWMISFIGDPLYTPFKVNPQLKPEQLSPLLQRALNGTDAPTTTAAPPAAAPARGPAANVETPPPQL